MSKNGRTNFRNQQKIKDEQINFLLGDLEKNLEEYRQALEAKEKQLSDAKRILLSAKQSYDKVAAENRGLKAYIQNLKQHFQREQQKQQLQFVEQQESYYQPSKKRTPKIYKKVIFEEEDESKIEPEFEEEEEFENKEVEQEPEIKKTKTSKTKEQSNNIFEYINKNPKRHKQ